jgi:hypothetical protein
VYCLHRPESFHTLNESIPFFKRNEILVGIVAAVGIPSAAILVAGRTMPFFLSRALDAGEGKVLG